MGPIGDGRRKRLIYAGVAVVALAIPATAVALVAGSPSATGHGTPPKSLSVLHLALVKRPIARTAAARFCGTLFTVKISERDSKRIYAGTGQVARHEVKVLRNIERCQREPAAEGLMRRFDSNQAQKHRERIAAAKAAAIARAKAAAAARAKAAAAARAQAAAEAAAQQTATVTASAASAGSPLPECTWLPESGGDPTAVNPTSGAGGYYQIMPSTWAAYGGTGLPQDAPLSEQTAIAEQIWATQGPSAWVNC
jgi:Transglycosylase-like domain